MSVNDDPKQPPTTAEETDASVDEREAEEQRSRESEEEVEAHSFKIAPVEIHRIAPSE